MLYVPVWLLGCSAPAPVVSNVPEAAEAATATQSPAPPMKQQPPLPMIPMSGPHETLTSYCQKRKAELAAAYCAGADEDDHHAADVCKKLRARTPCNPDTSIVLEEWGADNEAGGAIAFMLDASIPEQSHQLSCALALRTKRGWYVAERTLCDGAFGGGSPITSFRWQSVERLDTAVYAWEASVRIRQHVAIGDQKGIERTEGTSLSLCSLPPGKAPQCTPAITTACAFDSRAVTPSDTSGPALAQPSPRHWRYRDGRLLLRMDNVGCTPNARLKDEPREWGDTIPNAGAYMLDR